MLRHVSEKSIDAILPGFVWAAILLVTVGVVISCIGEVSIVQYYYSVQKWNLGVLITSNLSWSLHIRSICSKARKTTGLIYRTLYKHIFSSVLLRLHSSLILPH